MRFGMRSGLLAATALALVCSGPAAATDFLIPGKITIAKDTKLFKIVAKPVGTFTIPGVGSGADPQINDSNLEVFDTNGMGVLNDTLAVVGGWAGLGNPPGTTGYKYKNVAAPAGGAAKIIIVKPTVIKILAKDDGTIADAGITGNIGIRLTLGSDRYCAEAGTTAGTVIKNQAGLVKVKDAPAPGSCPSPPAPLTCCNGGPYLNFATVNAMGDCGDIINSTGTVVSNINCAGLYTGGGGNTVPLPYAVPDQGSAVTSITSCTGAVANVGGTSSTQTGSNYNCTNPGCRFGAPLTVPNPGSTPTSVCVLNNIATAPSGTVDCSNGLTNMAIPLASIIYLTGDTLAEAGIQPCPKCVGGICQGGADNGSGCTAGTSAINAGYPTSNDCEPDPMLSIGTLPIAFALTTGAVTWSGTTATNDAVTTAAVQQRIFSGFCRDVVTPGATGAFENPPQKCWENGMAFGPPCGGDTFETCEQRNGGAFGPNGGANRTITAIGVDNGILGGPAFGTLVSVFTIPPTFDPTVDGAGDLPGPGAVALPGTARICTAANPCP